MTFLYYELNSFAMADLTQIADQITQTLIRDRHALTRELRAIRKEKSKQHVNGSIIKKRILNLQKKTEQSLARKAKRQDLVPAKIHFDRNLPITAKKEDIIQAVQQHRVVIISGETGSGKTTQIPKFCLEAGRGLDGMIGCTQPRRIAAITVARRIADELSQPLGQAVGYKIRFDDRTDENALIKLMTDGILLAETQKDRFLNSYDTLIVDEAHERSLNIDFTLGLLRRLIQKRDDLKLIITSATIDTQKFSQAFGNAPVIEVSGRMYPVETRYVPFINKDDDRQSIEDQGYVEAAADAVETVCSKSRSGDILVFMPSEQDIGETMELIRGRQMAGTTVLPLFARLSAKEQSRVFSSQVGRKIIVATNVAETSLTIPGIKYVVDTGLARIPSYSPRTRTTALPVSPISQSSANQRMGRCGRVENGICIRLYDEDDFNGRPFFTSPEILRSNLAEVILRMISLNLGDITDFPFIDTPAPKSIKDGFDTLLELNAIREKKTQKKGRSYRLTPTGRIMATLPIDPKLSRILIEADRLGCLEEAAVIATAMAVSDPRQRPADKTAAADQQHTRFKDPSSDFITLLNIWTAYKAAEKKLSSRSKLKKWCQDHYLSFKRLREWSDIHRQITRILKEHQLTGKTAQVRSPEIRQLKSKAFEIGGPLYIALHKALLTGYLAHIAHKKEKNIFMAAKGQQAMIFPGSGLFDKAGNWIVAAEFVKTSQLFARTCANIDPEWLEPIAKDLCTRTYSDPHWEKKRGAVVAKEQVTLFGLIIVSSRTVSYGKINPEEAGEIFIRNALVDADIPRQFEFMTHNRHLIESLETLEHKTRKKDILASEDDIYLFYRSRLPHPFFDIRTFTRFIKDQQNQDFLKMSLEDIQKSRVDEKDIALFPDALTMPSGRFKLEYAFDPGSSKDGVTIQVPAASAPQVSAHKIDRLVPGLFEEKINALIKNLPKKHRVQLVPVSEKAAIIARELPDEDKPLFSLLSAFIRQRFNVTIPASTWTQDDLPDHLKMRISIRDSKGKEIKAVREKSILSQFAGTSPEKGEDPFRRAQKRFERSPVFAWDFGDITDPVIIDNSNGFTQKGYPGLRIETDAATEQKRVSLRLFKSETVAIESHQKAVGQLFVTVYQNQFTALQKDITRHRPIQQIAPSFCDRKTFAADMFNLIVSTVFEKNIRTQTKFDALAAQQIPGLYNTGQRILDTVAEMGKEYQACFELIGKLSLASQNKKKTFDGLTQLLSELRNLVPPNFSSLYDYSRIQHLQRFIACISIRAQKWVEHPLKEEQKAARIAPYSRHLNSVLSSLSEQSSEEKAQAVENFFWLLEEFKISVFAPQIKTAQKVSPKKLDKELTRISTMI